MAGPVTGRWRVKAAHPAHGGPIRVTDKAGNEIARSGQVCDQVKPEYVVSMLAQGWLEPVESEPAKEKA